MQDGLGGGPRHFEAIELVVAVGDHIFVRRMGYTHHGVEVAEAMVIHFTGTPGTPAAKLDAAIRCESIEVFASGGIVQHLYNTSSERAPSGPGRTPGSCSISVRWSGTP